MTVKLYRRSVARTVAQAHGWLQILILDGDRRPGVSGLWGLRFPALDSSEIGSDSLAELLKTWPEAILSGAVEWK